MKPIEDRAEVQAAIDHFVERQIHRQYGVIYLITKAKEWRDSLADVTTQYRWNVNIEHARVCELKAHDKAELTIRLARRIRQLDATRRSDHFGRRWSQNMPVVAQNFDLSEDEISAILSRAKKTNNASAHQPAASKPSATELIQRAAA